MSRGRKSSISILDSAWSKVFSKNVGVYLDVIFRSRSSDNEKKISFEKLKRKTEEAKDQFIKHKQIRLNSARPKDELLKLRYDIPSHWNWFLLSEVAFYQEGPGIRSFQYKTEGIKLLNVQNITPDKLQLELTSRYISKQEYESKYKHFKVEDGDILFASSGGSWGKACWYEDPGYDLVLNTSTMRLRTFSEGVLLNDFLYLFLKTDFFKEQLTIQLSGMQPNFGSTHLNSVSIPLPPVDEQKEILAFLNDLSRNELNSSEYFELKVEEKINQLHVAQMKCAEIFNENISQIESIKLLRQTILQEAVQGKLTKQDKDDEPATELLKRIKAEKQKLIKEGKLKKEKELPPITEDKIPFELPNGWAWCRLKELGFITGGGTPSTSKPAYWNGDIPWITPKDMKADHLNDAQEKVTMEGVKNSSAKLIPPNSILIVGRSGILKRTLPVSINNVECVVNQDLKVIVPYLKGLSRYIQLMLQGHEKFILQNLIKYGMTVHSLMYQEFELQPFPLPPLPEQQRIVTKVQQLQQRLTALETQVQQSRHYAQQLLQAVLKEAFEVNKKEYTTNEQLTMAAEE